MIRNGLLLGLALALCAAPAFASPTGDACQAAVEDVRGHPDAIALCETARDAEPESGEILFWLGLAYQAGGRGADAVATLEKAGDTGHAEASFELGRTLVFGLGVAPDLIVGLAALEQAENAGSIEAKSMLGALNMGYPGIPVNTEFGLKRLNEAAAAGSASAYLGLGTAYEFGQGVEKNLQTAHDWFKKAADAGDPIGLEEAARIKALIDAAA
jgi:TPR repeat protein